MSVKFKAGDLVQFFSKEETLLQGYLLSPFGAKYWSVLCLNKDISERVVWPEALIKKVVSSKNNLFEL